MPSYYRDRSAYQDRSAYRERLAYPDRPRSVVREQSTERFIEETIVYRDPETGERKRERRIRALKPREDPGDAEGQGAAWMKELRGEVDDKDQLALVRRSDSNRELAVASRRQESRAVEGYQGQDRRYERQRDQGPQRDDAQDDGNPGEQNDNQNRSKDQQQDQQDSGTPRNQNKRPKGHDPHHIIPKNEGRHGVNKHLDQSMDGLIAAAAGAAIGAIGTRAVLSERGDYSEYKKDAETGKTEDERLAENLQGSDKRKKYLTIGGAIAGALLFNLAENRYSEWMEEKEEEDENTAMAKGCAKAAVPIAGAAMK